MANQLRNEIHNKSLEVKKKIKELNNILSDLYNKQRKKQSNNVYNIKKTADKVNSAVNHLNNVDTKIIEKTVEGRERREQEDIAKLHKNTLANILLLEEYYKNKLSKEKREVNSSEIQKIKRNLDSLKLAYEDLRRLDTNMLLKSREWRELEQDL